MAEYEPSFSSIERVPMGECDADIHNAHMCPWWIEHGCPFCRGDYKRKLISLYGRGR